jgi:hypothetical protein
MRSWGHSTPVAAVERTPRSVAMTREQALAVFESFAHLGDPAVDAIAELKAGRR